MINPKRIPQLQRSYRPRSPGSSNGQAWLDIVTLLAWGVMLVKYAVTGKLNVLLHPDYMWLAHSASVGLLGLGGFKVWVLLRSRRRNRWSSNGIGNNASNGAALAHATFFPSRWSSSLLLATAILGLFFTPRPFASQTALDRGITDTLTATRAQPQPFRTAIQPEDRSLVDWRRTLNVYPEPDAYDGDPVLVQGFVIQPPDLPADHFLIARFVITCCAADVYPIGLPVKRPAGSPAYDPDTWLEVSGTMTSTTLAEERQLVIAAESLTEIPEPDDPYNY